jgi:hypothetical protein
MLHICMASLPSSTEFLPKNICMIKWSPTMVDPDITQKERREILENDRKVRATYFSQAQANMDDERGGRYATLNKPSVTGSSPSVMVPQQPANSFWSCDPVPPEMPLGYDINAMEPVGEKFEIEKSLSSAASGEAVAPTSSVVGDSKGVGVNKRRWRRI